MTMMHLHSARGPGSRPSYDDEIAPPPRPSPYAVVSRLAQEGALGHPDATFELGLTWLLDGVAATVARGGA